MGGGATGANLMKRELKVLSGYLRALRAHLRESHEERIERRPNLAGAAATLNHLNLMKRELKAKEELQELGLPPREESHEERIESLIRARARHAHRPETNLMKRELKATLSLSSSLSSGIT